MLDDLQQQNEKLWPSLHLTKIQRFLINKDDYVWIFHFQQTTVLFLSFHVNFIGFSSVELIEDQSYYWRLKHNSFKR